MISLRKHIDSYRAAGPEKGGAPLPDPCLAALRSALVAMGDSGQRAVPSLGGAGLSEKLNEISRSLSGDNSGDDLHRATTQVRTELSRWAERAALHHNENERELREIIGVVARAAETVGIKDDKYNREIGALTARMRSIADLKDLSVIRRSILESTTLLQTCVERMAAEGQSTVQSLSLEVAAYRTRLEEAELTAAIDALTHIANRRAFEASLERKIAVRENFSLLLIDLNDFKLVNDTHGHVAGDDLLKKFAAELAAQFSNSDMACRWGGDEFAVMIAGSLREAQDKADRVRKWALGEYRVSTGAGQSVKVEVTASIGAVQWNGRETQLELLARADREMYHAKRNSRPATPDSRPVTH